MQQYTISAVSENTIRVLQRMAGIFGRNRVNIEKLSVWESEKKGVSLFSIAIKSDEKTKNRVVAQLRKMIELEDVKVIDEMKGEIYAND